MGLAKERRPLLAPSLQSADEVATKIATAAATAQSAAETAQAAAEAAQADVTAWVDIVAAETLIGTYLGAAMYRKRVVISAGPNNSTISIAHGITSLGTVVRIFGTITDGTTQFPLAHGADQTGVATSMRVFVDATNLNLGAGANYSSFAGAGFIEYTKTA